MERKEKIIKVARDLIAHYGFRKTTMEDIAKASGIAKATLYHYFRSKEDILREIINFEGEMLRTKLLEIVESDLPASEKLKRYSRVRMHYLKELVVYYKTLSEEYYSHIPFIEHERRRFDIFEHELFKRMLEQGIEQCEFRPIEAERYALVLIQAVKALELPIATGQALRIGDMEVDLDEMLDIMLDILLNGIGLKSG